MELICNECHQKKDISDMFNSVVCEDCVHAANEEVMRKEYLESQNQLIPCDRCNEIKQARDLECGLCANCLAEELNEHYESLWDEIFGE